MAKEDFKDNKGILDRKRFERMEEERIIYLQSMTLEKSIRIMEALLDSGILKEFKRIQKRVK